MGKILTVPKFIANDLFDIDEGRPFMWYDVMLPPHDCLLVDRLRKSSTVDEEVSGGASPTPAPTPAPASAPLTRTEIFFLKAARRFVLFTMPSWTHPKAKRYYTSTAALNAERRRQARTTPFVVHPFSPLRFYWELVMGIVVLLTMVIVPLRIMIVCVCKHNIMKFGEELLFSSLLIDIFMAILDVFYILEIVIFIVTGVVDDTTRTVYFNYSTIKRNYFKKRFALDVVTAVPYSILRLLRGPTIYSLLEMLKVFRAYVIFDAIKLFLQKAVQLWCIAIKFITAILVPLLVIHWLSCCFLMFSVLKQGDDKTRWDPNSWLRNLDYHLKFSQTFSTLYWLCVYRFLEAALCMKNNNTMPPEDVVVTIVSIIAGAVLFTYVTVRCIIIFRIFYVATSQVTGKVRQLEEFMKYRDLPQQQRARLMEYFSYCFNNLAFREDQVLDFVSGNLREDIMLHSCRAALDSVPFFKNLPLNVLVHIVLCLRNEIFMENEVVVQAGTPGNSMYFIVSGTVVIYSASGNEICHLEDGAHFGEIAMLSGDETRIASVVAIETCELYCLERDDFLGSVADNPELLRSMEATALQRLDQTVTLDEKSLRFTSKKSQQRAQEARRISLDTSDTSQSSETK